MARRRISFVICYIAFKTRISYRKHMKRGAHLLAPGPEDVKGVLGGKWCCCWMGSVWGDKAHKRERGFALVISVTMFSSLSKRLTSTQLGSTVTMCLFARVVTRSSRPTTASTDTRHFLVASLTTGRAFAPSPCGARREKRKRKILSSSRKGADILYHLNWKSLIWFLTNTNFVMLF